MASTEITLEPKNIEEMLAGLKKAAKSSGFDLKGDNKKGSGKGEPATIEYVVKGQKVTVSFDNKWNFLDLERVVEGWLKPYKK